MNAAITKRYERITTSCKEISLRFDGRLKLGTICSGMGTAEMVTRSFSETWEARGDTPLEAGLTFPGDNWGHLTSVDSTQVETCSFPVARSSTPSWWRLTCPSATIWPSTSQKPSSSRTWPTWARRRRRHTMGSIVQSRRLVKAKEVGP